MLLLATDTSGKHGSIALVRAVAGGDGRISGTRSTALQPGPGATAGLDLRVIEVVPLAGGTFSAQLVPQTASLLAKHGFTKHDIGGFVVASGPGSFTGLRVGLAAIKALAEVLHKPIASVSLLEAIATISGVQGNVIALLDAGRGEAYVGEYEITADSVRTLKEELLSKDKVWTLRGAELVTADEALAAEARAAGLAVSTIDALDAGTIAALGWRKILAGDVVSPEALEANYIRRSDAEIFAKNSL